MRHAAHLIGVLVTLVLILTSTCSQERCHGASVAAACSPRAKRSEPAPAACRPNTAGKHADWTAECILVRECPQGRWQRDHLCCASLAASVAGDRCRGRGIRWLGWYHWLNWLGWYHWLNWLNWFTAHDWLNWLTAHDWLNWLTAHDWHDGGQWDSG